MFSRATAPDNCNTDITMLEGSKYRSAHSARMHAATRALVRTRAPAPGRESDSLIEQASGWRRRSAPPQQHPPSQANRVLAALRASLSTSWLTSGALSPTRLRATASLLRPTLPCIGHACHTPCTPSSSHASVRRYTQGAASQEDPIWEGACHCLVCGCAKCGNVPGHLLRLHGH